MLEFLLASGADPNAKDNDDMTTLMLMADSTLPALLLDFVRSGQNIDLTALNNKGQSALSIAQEYAKYDKGSYNYVIIQTAITAQKNSSPLH